MSTLIERFGAYVGNKAETDPKAARRLILAAYRGFGWYQKHKPDPRRPNSRQILADASMKFMVDGFSHPQKAALVSIFTPCEILQAFGIHPMCAEMFSTYLNGAGAEAPFVAASEAAGISSTFCSYHKVLMGAAETGVLPRTGFIVNTSLACDANNLTFRAISEQMGIEQMYIDVPYAKNDASVDYVADQLRQLPAFIEKQTGTKMNEVLFREAIERSHETIRLLRASIPYRKTKWLSGDLTSELYEALMVHTALGSREALAYARALLEDYPQLVAYPLGGRRTKLAAGWLIDAVGFKGRTKGRAAVWSRQALVLVNQGGAAGAEVKALADDVISAVERKFGISLTPEVAIL